MQPQNSNEINTQRSIADGDSSVVASPLAAGNRLSRALRWLARQLPARKIQQCNDDGSTSHFLQRYPIIDTQRFGLYLHQLMPRPADMAMHDHPWHAVSLVLTGGYREERLCAGLETIEREVRWFNWLQPERFHRITHTTPGTWTLVIRFRRVKVRGFIGAVVNGQASYRPAYEDVDSSDQVAPPQHVI